MKSKKTVRKALWMSVLSIALCLTMLVGTTFAWFTDTASTAVNKIQAGTLDVVMSKDATGENSIEGTTLNWVKAEGAAANEAVLWEPGCTYNLDSFYIVNKGNLALKYKVVITGIEGNSKLLEAIDFTIAEEGGVTTNLATWEGGILLPSTATAEVGGAKIGHTGKLTISGKMRTDAGNEYQGLSIDGIGITVYATQYTYEYDSENNQYDKDSDKDTAYYSLSEFNALTEIPAEIKNVYVNIGTVSLKDGSVVIGNDNIRDKYERNSTTEDRYGVSYTDKSGINLIIDGGTIKDGPAVDNSVANKIAFRIPDKSTVTFNNVKIEGFFGLSGATSDNPYGSVMPHKIAGVTFDHCTFDALWFQNGSFGTSQITIKNSTFNKHENSVYSSNTNPLWFKNIGQTGTNISIDNCVFNTNRPVKVVEQDVSGQTVSITNCTFNMEGDGEYKNAAIMFSTTSTGSTLGNVVVSGNKVNSGVALLTFYNPAQITMAEGASFTVSNNTLGTGVKTSVVWKSNTEFTPDFMK